MLDYASGQKQFDSVLACGRFSSKSAGRIQRDKQQMHAVKLLVDQAGGVPEFAVRVESVNPTILHHQSAQSHWGETYGQQDRCNDQEAVAHHRQTQSGEPSRQTRLGFWSWRLG